MVVGSTPTYFATVAQHALRTSIAVGANVKFFAGNSHAMPVVNRFWPHLQGTAVLGEGELFTARYYVSLTRDVCSCVQTMRYGITRIFRRCRFFNRFYLLHNPCLRRVFTVAKEIRKKRAANRTLITPQSQVCQRSNVRRFHANWRRKR